MTEKLRRLFRVKKTESMMMKTRGFNINSVNVSKGEEWSTIDLESIMNLSFEEFLVFSKSEGIFENRESFSSLYTNSVGEQILILYLLSAPGKTVSKDYFKVVNDTLKFDIFNHLILITENGLNVDSNNAIKNNTLGIRIEVFKDIELAFNRTKHCYAPIDITYIKNKDVAKWSDDEEVQAEKLPLITHLDIIAKWYGASPKDVLAMTVMGCGTDTAIFNRCVRQTPNVKK